MKVIGFYIILVLEILLELLFIWLFYIFEVNVIGFLCKGDFSSFVFNLLIIDFCSMVIVGVGVGII